MCVVVVIDANSMNIIIEDTNLYDKFFKRWLINKNGIIAFAKGGKYEDEVQRSEKFKRMLVQYERSGQLITVSQSALSDSQNKIHDKSIKSDDLHILTLALASGAQILISQDKNLGKDFKNNQILPRTDNGFRKLYPILQNDQIRRNFLQKNRCMSRV